MKKTKLFFGFIFILTAIVLLLNQLDVIPSNTMTFKIISCVILIPLVVYGIIKLRYTFIFFPAAGLFLTFAQQLGFENASPWLIFSAALLLSVGCYVMFPKRRKMNVKAFSSNTVTDDQSKVYIQNRGSGCNRYVTSRALEEIVIDSSCGGTNVYLSDACASGKIVELKLHMSCSGVTLYIPQNWRIDCKAENIMSGITVPNPPNERACDVTLLVTGEVSLSGLRFNYA